MKIFYFLLITSLIIGACRKSERDKDTELQSSKDFAKSLKIFLNVFRTADYYSKNTAGIYKLNQSQSGCDSIWYDTLSATKKVIIDFGTGCSSFDNITKKGRMIITYSSRYSKTNNIANITLENFSLYDEKITGSINITNISDTAANAIPTYAFNVSGGKITSGDKHLEFTALTKIITSSGQTTAISSDDVFKISGTFTGRSYSNNNYSCKTTSDIEYGYSCEYPLAGKTDLTPANLGQRNLDFGSGCDSKFTIVLFYNTYEETIP